LEEALHEARENTRAASEARADAANALAAKERELADVAALRAAAAEEATRARLAEYALSERLADVSTSAKVTQAERDDLSGELVTLKETHDTLSGGFQKLRDENETLIRVQNETSRRDAAVLQQHKEKLEAKEREFVELKRLRDEADANAETWKRRVERTEAELHEMSVSTARATDERQHAMDAEARAVSLLETKLSSLDSTLSKQVESLQTRLNNAQSALAKAEAKMLVMARDLAEAEEELEMRDALVAEEGRRVASTKETSQVRLIETRQGMNDAVPVVETSSTGVSDHPIFSKTRNNRHVEVERMLKALDFDPNVRDKHGNTVRTALVLSQIQAPTFAHTRPAKGRLTSALTVYVIHIQDRSW
jgi:chromosome segregation ATPase